MNKMIARSAAAIGFALALAACAPAAPPAPPAPPSAPIASVSPGVVDLSREQTYWRINESWNEDDLVYTLEPNGVFRSPSGATGRWIQTDTRVVLDWPSYGAVYVGVLSAEQISGTAFMDDGTLVGRFVMTREAAR